MIKNTAATILTAVRKEIDRRFGDEVASLAISDPITICAFNVEGKRFFISHLYKDLIEFERTWGTDSLIDPLVLGLDQVPYDGMKGMLATNIKNSINAWVKVFGEDVGKLKWIVDIHFKREAEYSKS